MPLFKCEPGMEISGNLAISMLVNLQAENFRPFLQKYGFADVKPDQWYSYQDFLHIFKEVSEQPGAMFNFVAIGMAAVDRYDFPAHIASMSLEDFFLKVMPSMIDRHYRNGTLSQIAIEKVAEKHLLIRMNSAYPDDTAYGFIYEFARRFMKGGQFIVKYDENHRRHDSSGENILIHLTWQ